MSNFTNIVGGTVLAASVATGVQAEQPISADLVQTQPERVQLYDLPTVVLHNFFEPPEETFRNPAGRGVSIVPYDSVGPVDERQPVTHGNRAYDPVVQMTDVAGNAFCTATASNIEGFEASFEGTIFTTAAHCMQIYDENRNPIGWRQPEDILLQGSYIDEQGMIQTYFMRGDADWVNPLYQENIDADAEFFVQNGYSQDRILEADTALIFSRQVLPNEVTPAITVPVDFEAATQIRDQLYSAQMDGENLYVTVAGHSSDRPYLTVHEEARAVYGDYDGLNAASDIVPGASGGPMFLSIAEGEPIALSENGEPIQLGVNSTIIDGTDLSRHSYFNSNTLYTVPFLDPEGTPDGEICTQSAEITATELNIRVGAGVSYQTLAVAEGMENSRLPMGSSVILHDTTRNELGQEWGLVTTADDRTGYISMNSDYVHVQPEECFTLKF